MLGFGKSLPASRRDETSTNAGSVDEVFTSIEANDDGVDTMGSRRISADNKFLAKIDAMLSPQPCALARLIKHYRLVSR